MSAYMLETMLFTLYCGGRPVTVEMNGKSSEMTACGTGSPAAGLGSLVRHIGHYPHYPAKCVDNVPGQHPSLPAQPSVWRHLGPISRVVTR